MDKISIPSILEAKDFQKSLTQFIKDYGFIALKAGTETEDMDWNEVEFFQAVANEQIPVWVKIGGPEARNDIRNCLRLGIDGIAAPMIESEYALRNFIDTLKQMMNAKEYSEISKSINLETITGYRSMMDIYDSPAFKELHHVTAARSDLSNSMGKKPDDPEVTKVTKQIIQYAKDYGKVTSVGGTITRFNFGEIASQVKPHYINSRHIVVDLSKIPDFKWGDTAEAMLLFEMELYQAMKQLNPEKEYAYQKRIEVNRERIGEKKKIYFIR
jgi:hypothetical protein